MKALLGLVPAAALLAAAALATPADASILWAKTDNAGIIGRANVDGTGATQSFMTGLNRPFDVAVDGEYVYWSRWDGAFGAPPGSSIGRARLDGSESNPNFIPLTGGSGVQGLTVSGTHIYWTNGGFLGSGDTIGRASIDGTGVDEDWLDGIGTARDVAVNDTHVYWGNAATDDIGRANLDGSSPNPSFITAASIPMGIALDDTHVYWSNNNSFAVAQTITRARLDGTGLETIVPDAPGSNNFMVGLATDETHLYWIDTGLSPAPALGRIRKDGTGLNRTFVTGFTGGNNHGLAVQHASETSVECDPAAGPATQETTCTATVEDADSAAGVPEGTVSFSADGDGAFGSDTCTLAGEEPSCSVTYTPAEPGVQEIAAAYAGNSRHAASSGAGDLTVFPASPSPTGTALVCSPAALETSTPTTCTATVTDAGIAPSVPDGTVSFSADGAGGFAPQASCELAPSDGGASSCSVTYTPSAAGAQAVEASYAGNPFHAASSGQVELDVDDPPVDPDPDPDPPQDPPPDPPPPPPPPPPPAPPAPPAPSASFTVGQAKLNRRKGTAALTVRLPGPGRLAISGAGVKRASTPVSRAGSVTVRVAASGRALRRLRRAGRVRLRVTIRFTPSGGAPTTRTRTLRLVKA